MRSGVLISFLMISVGLQAQSFKEFVAKKHADDIGYYNIVAERPHETIIDYRTNGEYLSLPNARNVMEIMDDAKEYCESVNGKLTFGDQSIDTLEKLPTGLSFSYTGYRNAMKKQGRGVYEGFMKCDADPQNAFAISKMLSEVEASHFRSIAREPMQDYSRLYKIEHKAPQSTGQKIWLTSEKFRSKTEGYPLPRKYFGAEDENNKNWWYGTGIGAQKYCTYNGGKLYIANWATGNVKMGIDEYYFNRWSSMEENQKPTILMVPLYQGKDVIWCENPSRPEQEFALDRDGKSYTFHDADAKAFLASKNIDMKESNYYLKGPKEDLVQAADKKANSAVLAKNNELVKFEKELAIQTLATKSDTIMALGQNKYETSYNGSDTCEYASVTKMMPSLEIIHNFKKCGNNDVEYIGETGPNDITPEAKRQLAMSEKAFGMMCQMQGSVNAKFNEFDVKCVSSASGRKTKTVIMKDGKLILKVYGR